MDQTDDYITEEKRHALMAELEDLKGPKRKEILASLKYAKSLGDLAENAEYHQTREDQGKLEERIAKIELILKSSHTVEPQSGNTVGIGSKVVVQKDGSGGASAEKKTYVIVGSEEADMAEGKVSNRSPFGAALYGKKKGDEVTFSSPGGEVNYKIIDVS